MNIQHSSRTDEWYTPPELLERVRMVLGRIELDPASDAEGNARVLAARFLTKDDDGLSLAPESWGVPDTVFLNPPGGKRGRNSLAALFWQRLMFQRITPGFQHAIFLAFSLEQLQTTQRVECRPIADFPFVVPAKRVQFLAANGGRGLAPSHSNMIVYVPGRFDCRDRFFEVFGSMGAAVNRQAMP